MKILFVAPRYHTNQVPIVEALLANNHEVKFFVQYIGGSEDHSLINPEIVGYNMFFKIVHKFKFNRPNDQDTFKFERNYGMPTFYKYYKMIKKYSPDLVIIRDRTLFSLLTFSICKILKINSILYKQVPKFKSINETKNKGVSQRLKHVVYKMLVSPITITPINGESEIDRFTSENIHYLPFIMKISNDIGVKKYFRNNVINIVSVGKFVPRKRHVLLIQAMKYIGSNYNVKLTIIGEVTTDTHKKEYQKVTEYIKKNNLEDIVEIKTNIKLKDVQDEYLRNDLFILPSINEPLSISIIEAMSYGLPVICSDTCGTKDYIEEGLNGYVFKSDDLNDLKEKIIKIIHDKSTLRTMGKASFELVKTKYSPERYHETLMGIIDEEFG